MGERGRERVACFRTAEFESKFWECFDHMNGVADSAAGENKMIEIN